MDGLLSDNIIKYSLKVLYFRYNGYKWFLLKLKELIYFRRFPPMQDSLGLNEYLFLNFRLSILSSGF